MIDDRPVVLWLTGLSGAGKSTIAGLLETRLREEGVHVLNLDGDIVRTGLNSDLGFSLEDRHENIRRIAEVARILFRANVSVIVSAISPLAEGRAFARSIIPEGRFVEIFVDAPLEIVESRDTKGLYQRARNGELSDFTGVGSPYEAPTDPDIRVDTVASDPDESVSQILEALAAQFSAG